MSQSAREAALTALAEWWEEAGVYVDRTELRALMALAGPADAGAPRAPETARTMRPRSPVVQRSLGERVAEAAAMAAGAATIDELKAAIEAYDGCPLKAGANKTVVHDGVHGAPLMVIGEGAGGTEDEVGLPFVGKAGQLLDRMLAAIGVSRETNAFITNVTYWRPPGNRNPEPEELAVCRPFVDRMIELGTPRLIIAAGAVPAQSLIGTSTGIMKLRGKAVTYMTPGGYSAPLVPVLHPAYLLRRPVDKSRAWRDLLLVRSMLTGL